MPSGLSWTWPCRHESLPFSIRPRCVTDIYRNFSASKARDDVASSIHRPRLVTSASWAIGIGFALVVTQSKVWSNIANVPPREGQ